MHNKKASRLELLQGTTTSFFRKLGWLMRRRIKEAELREEIQFHIEEEAEEREAQGLTREEAQRAGRLDLGNIGLVQEDTRTTWGWPRPEQFVQDILYAAHALWRQPAFSVAAVLTLALGIGATTMIFSIVNGVLLKPLPYPEPGRLVSLAHVSTAGPAASSDFLYFTYAEHSKTFQASGLWAARAATITGQGDAEQVNSLLVTSEVLSLLGVTPARGRLFTAGDGQPNAPLTTVLTYGYWQRRFGGDESVLGQRLMIDNLAHEIVGVMPRNFRFLDVQAELFRPVQLNRKQVVQGNFAFQGIARLKPGISLDQASTDMARMIPIAIDSFPTPGGMTRDQIRTTRLAPNPKLLKDAVVGNVGDTLWVLMGTIGLVLLIACANVANLFIVRTEGRHRELAVRSALGASRFRVASGVLAEAVILGAAGGLLGYAAAYAGLRLVLQNAPANLPRAGEIHMDSTVLAFTTLLAVGTGLLFGLAPALRYAAPRLSSTLRAGGRTMSSGRDGRQTRAGLVIAQVGLALVLLIASGLMLRTYQSLVNVDPGFKDPETLQLAHIVFPRGTTFDPQQAAQTLRQMVEAAEALPGITAASYASTAPLENGSVTSTLYLEGFTKEGQLPAQRLVKFISPKFFETLGVPLLAGRDLEWVDHFDYRTVAMVSENLAKEVWGSPREALGKHVRTNPSDPWREIVGVVGDVHDNGMSQPVNPTVYFPFLMKSFWTNPTLFWGIGTLALRTPRAGSEAVFQEMQTAVRSVNAGIPLATPSTMGDLYRRSMARTSFTLVLLSIAGLMSLLLGIVGIYSVIAYSVSRRRREIGIRLALGASPAGVRRLFTREAMGLVAVGTGVGLVAAFGFTRLMDSLLFGVKPSDPATFLLVPLTLAAVAALASYVPARRAVRVDPIETLRHD
jgi:predicted permease